MHSRGNGSGIARTRSFSRFGLTALILLCASMAPGTQKPTSEDCLACHGDATLTHRGQWQTHKFVGESRDFQELHPWQHIQLCRLPYRPENITSREDPSKGSVFDLSCGRTGRLRS